jgi:DNA polymerase III alpha subunit
MELQDKSKMVFRYPNAIKRKYKNKQVTICKLSDGTYHFEAVNFDKEFANEPAVGHETKKGVIRISAFRMSKETLEAFIINAIELLEREKAPVETGAGYS